MSSHKNYRFYKILKKLLPAVLILLVIVVSVCLLYGKLAGFHKLYGNFYLSAGNSVFVLDAGRLTFARIYANPSAARLVGKILQMNNEYAIFMSEPVKDEKNLITAWVDPADNTKVKVVELNSRLLKSREYQVQISLAAGLQLVEAVSDLRPAMGGQAADGRVDDGQNLIWVIPRFEPVADSGSYMLDGSPVRYTDTIRYPVIVRSAGRVEYRYKHETLPDEQPLFYIGE